MIEEDYGRIEKEGLSEGMHRFIIKGSSARIAGAHGPRGWLC